MFANPVIFRSSVFDLLSRSLVPLFHFLFSLIRRSFLSLPLILLLFSLSLSLSRRYSTLPVRHRFINPLLLACFCTSTERNLRSSLCAVASYPVWLIARLLPVHSSYCFSFRSSRWVAGSPGLSRTSIPSNEHSILSLFVKQ